MRLEVEWEKCAEWRSYRIYIYNLDADPPMQLDYYTENKPTKSEVKAFSRDAFIKFQQFEQKYKQETAHRRGNGEE